MHRDQRSYFRCSSKPCVFLGSLGLIPGEGEAEHMGPCHPQLNLQLSSPAFPVFYMELSHKHWKEKRDSWAKIFLKSLKTPGQDRPLVHSFHGPISMVSYGPGVMLSFRVDAIQDSLRLQEAGSLVPRVSWGAWRMKPQVCPGRDPQGDKGWSWDGVSEVSGSGNRNPQL